MANETSSSRALTPTFLLFVLTTLLSSTARRSVESVESDLFVQFLHFRRLSEMLNETKSIFLSV